MTNNTSNTVAPNPNLLGTAIALAAETHENQRDKGGNAYILHPLRIMMRLRTDDEELMSIAILHDVVEDSDITIETLTKMGFTKRVTDALTLLTHSASDTYEVYIKKIATNEDAITVKLEDLKDNSDITRLKGVRDKDFQRIIKYNKAYAYLKGVQKTSKVVGY